MKIDYAYMELIAKIPGANFNSKSLEELTAAVEDSSIHIFGWPIACVIRTNTFAPQAIKNGIEATINYEGHRDYWMLNRETDFYYIGELFENSRSPQHIFIDTRTNRIAETFLRTGKLYEILNVDPEEIVQVSIKHGNILKRILGAANPSRFFPTERVCNVNEVATDFELPLKDFQAPEKLKINVYTALRELSEMFGMFHPDKEKFSDPIVDAFLQGRII